MAKKSGLSIKRNKWRHAAGILAIVWMCIIFSFSAQDKEESSEVSGGFSYQIVSSTKFFFHLNLSEEQLREIADSIEGFIRKAAHMAEYAVLSVLLYIWIGYWDFVIWKKASIAILTAALYAGSDELHQRFVAGRAGRFSDVLIDSAGAALGVAVWALLVRGIIALRQRKRKAQ